MKLTFLEAKYQTGFSLVEILVAIGVAGIVAMGTAQIIIQSTKTGAESERLYWLSARRLELQGLVKSSDGWNSLLANNPDLLCLSSSSGCASFTSAQPLKIPINGKILDGSAPTLGMTNKGDFCNSFDPTKTSSDCPIGIKMQWLALCDDGSCLHAQPKIKIQFYDVNSSSADLKSYNLEIFRDPKLETLNEFCSAMGGTLIGTSCSVPQLNTACSPSTGSFVLGFDNSGNVICGKPNPGSCASSDVAIGFTTNGSIQCAPACTQ